MKPFYRLLGIALLVLTTNNFVWFALTFWAYLSTKSVVSTSILAGCFTVMTAISGIFMGSIVDHNKKKHAMLGSSLVTLTLFVIGLVLYRTASPAEFETVASLRFWAFAVTLLAGAIAGSVYNIAIPTLVPVLVPEDRRDRANGMFGTTMGIAFAITSVFSGLGLAYGGMGFVLTAAPIALVVCIALLAITPIPEPDKAKVEPSPSPGTGLAAPASAGQGVDLRGTIAAVRAIPGLFGLIIFATINNFLGGVFFALMDAYGLTLVTVQVWGALWGFLSISFILGGLYIARYGLGSNPLRILFRNNIICWTICIFFTVQPSIVLLVAGTFIWMFLMPFIEAIEQTIFQKVVPPERLGRVFGFAHSVEQSASPITAFLIGPIAQWFFIPFMVDGAGVNLIGSWFGTGPGRGMALVFILAGSVGLIVTLIAMRSRFYTLLARRYNAAAADEPDTEPRPPATNPRTALEA
jgi:DHA3 family multidrug efflux protein-like MFS transporter